MPTLADYHAPYPDAPAGMKRCVIYLDPKDEADEQNHLKIELIPGRVTYCEDPKSNFLSGSIEERTIDGWGYDYYTVQMGSVVDKQGNTVSTRNSVNFVPLTGTGPTLRYNSKLPIVVYVPQDAEVRYRVWSDETVRAQDRNSVTTRGGASQATAAPVDREAARAVQGARPSSRNNSRPSSRNNSRPGSSRRPTKPISSAYAETGLSSTEVSPSRNHRASTSSAPFSSRNARSGSTSKTRGAPTSITSREAGAPVEHQVPSADRGFEAEQGQHASGSRNRHRGSSSRQVSNVEESPSRSNRGAAGEDGKSPRRSVSNADGEGARSPPRHHSAPRGDKTLYDRMSPRRSSMIDEARAAEEAEEGTGDDGKKHRSLINRMRKKSTGSNPNSPQRSHRNYDNEL